jgi:tRNA 2-thiouridine synthesizing protein E
MSSIEVNGKQFEVDEEGYLANLNEWEPAVGEAMCCR